jgi:hypothetical protein
MCRLCAGRGLRVFRLCVVQVVRGHWERPDALIVSDCGALANMQRFRSAAAKATA